MILMTIKISNYDIEGEFLDYDDWESHLKLSLMSN